MKVSRIAAKIAVRLFFILTVLAVATFTQSKPLGGLYVGIPNKWLLVFPVILIVGFVWLLIICVKQKYTRPDMNWLLVLNTFFLIAYGIRLYIFFYGMLLK